MHQTPPPSTPLIIGAGIAGLATAAALRGAGIGCALVERRAQDGPVGFGFLVMPNGVAALDRLGLGEAVRDRAQRMRRLTIYTATPNRPPLVDVALGPDHLAVDRRFLLDKLSCRAAPRHGIRWRTSVTGLSWGPGGRLAGAVTADGQRLSASLVIGADGVSSPVRRALFPEAERTPLHIWEMVTVARAPEAAAVLHGRLVKFLDRRAGRAVGMLPLDRQRIIVYLQMDHARWPLPPPDGDGRRRLAVGVVRRFPDLARKVIDGCSFDESHFYVTGDLDPLPTSHRGGAVLIGDAAHPLSPFTSQGVATALEDATALAEVLAPALSGGAPTAEALDACLTRYHERRAPDWRRRLLHGRALAGQFLAPEDATDVSTPFSA